MRRPPSSGRLTACAVLGLILVGCALIASATMVVLVLAPVVAGLLASALDRSGGLIATRMVRLASCLLPANVRTENGDEWVDHVMSAGEVGLRPVLIAIEIACVTAPKIALRLRLRPLAGRYILALFLTAIEVVRADPRERRRGSTFSLAKAVVRLGALYTLPLLALPTMRRTDLALRRWLLYAIGFATEFGLSTLTNGMSFWLVAIVSSTAGLITLCLSMLVVLKHEVVIQFASRLAGSDHE